jgi:hypothetical protein
VISSHDFFLFFLPLLARWLFLYTSYVSVVSYVFNDILITYKKKNLLGGVAFFFFLFFFGVVVGAFF